ncbi:(Fe-S)-binding protein [Saccharococcus caldoxylosilyticus]|uniref:Glycolate oxidase iron-sulfur subunit n=1 Tax=Saccharococcus caldoxylosilyticus TaxID=81408 RepID=A0A150KTX5_9BACL|nr:(Fe-S)-binding protein [Parageobacillus caldoxylosilyticus]OQO99226.1 glycolate oxidase [Geobacillus sp. 44B]KYD03575.1 Glycolate dehydrogenase, iron-sulfur subunit GlcF [Parageobacillus caldoxylosilyticus]QNU38383.1 (Fe-S)-binding protein [Geobacillus sp. 44B]QXJ38056.1 Lactate utilization protein A [Parageobacillus caldoxylosilyticus]BDG34468.1 putative glycolate oxidase iron-sulfur subunit [Parageobacillus caldoxylosilyticus]
MTTEKEREIIQKQFQERMDEDELMNCMRCGFCLPTCPTYIESGFQESHSPRGRIALMKAVVDRLIEPDEDVERSLNMCLGCRACEPVCPSGVRYGHLLEEAHDIIQQHKKHSFLVRVVRKLVFHELFPYPERMRMAMGLIGFYQRSGLQSFARKTGLLNILPSSLRQMEKVLPNVPPLKEMKERPHHLAPEGPVKRRVAFFTGCLMDTMFMATNDATMRLLQLAGCEVIIPPAQTCCGALHGHGGEKQKAKELAKRNIEAFERLEVDDIVTNAGGCGAFLMEYDHLLKDEAEWSERAKAFVAKIKDISEVLVELDFQQKRLKVPPQIVTYQDSCHLRNVMKTSAAPRKLLRAIEGVEFREMKDADRCCGSAGIYNIVEPEMSMQILDYKMEMAKQTKAATIVTANPGCLLQVKLGIERAGLADRVRAVHLVDFLLEAAKGIQASEQEEHIRKTS